MLVENKHLTTIWYEQTIDKVKIIDQRLIPFELKIIELNLTNDEKDNFSKSIDAVKQLFDAAKKIDPSLK